MDRRYAFSKNSIRELNTMREKNLYIRANITGKKTSIKTVVRAFVLATAGITTTAKRAHLPELKSYVLECTHYVKQHLPVGVDYVDGYCIEPILQAVCAEEIGKLPVLKGEEYGI